MGSRAKNGDKDVSEAAQLLANLAKDDIEDIIKKSISSAIGAFKSELTDILNHKLDSIQKDLKDKDESILKLQQMNLSLQQEVRSLSQRQDAADVYSKKDNLVIYGLPVSYSEVTH